MSKRLIEIMSIKEKDRREIELRKYAKELGCSLQGTYTQNGVHLEQEVINRIREAEKDLEQQNPLELKPNIYGIGIDLKKMWNRIRAKWQSKKNIKNK